MQYFKSLLCFAVPLNESEFLIVFSHSFPVIYLWIHCSIQTSKLVNYWLTSPFRGPGSQVLLENFGVPGPTWLYSSPRSWVPLMGLGFYFSGMLQIITHVFRDLQLKNLWSQDHVIWRDKFDKIWGINILKSAQLYSVISLEAATRGVL